MPMTARQRSRREGGCACATGVAVYELRRVTRRRKKRRPGNARSEGESRRWAASRRDMISITRLSTRC